MKRFPAKHSPAVIRAVQRFLARHSPMVILALLCIGMAAVSPGFRTAENLQNVTVRTLVIAIIAIGQTMVILNGGIDLSVGSVAALSGVLCGLVMNAFEAREWPLAVFCGMAAGCAAGLAAGLTSGVLWAKGRIPPFIATLGMMMAARGIAFLLSKGVPVSGFPERFYYLGGSILWWVPVAITLAITVVFTLTLGFTRFGRAVYATGGNLTGARLSGIAVDRVRIAAFGLCGLLTGLSGIILASRTSIAGPTAAEGYELDSIAACVIGGASLMGGEGGCIGAVAGALIMSVLRNFCNLQGIDEYWQRIVVGVLVVALVYYDNLRKRRAGLLKD